MYFIEVIGATEAKLIHVYVACFSVCDVTCNEANTLWDHYKYGKKHKIKINVERRLIPDETPTIPSLGAIVKIEGKWIVLQGYRFHSGELVSCE